MSSRTRTSLNAIRALAAIYVVVHHLALSAEIAGPVKILFKFGQEAVMVFFLLSGFLIFHHEKHRVQTDLRGYYFRRLRRVYPPLIVALALSALIAWLGGTLAADFDFRALVLNLLSLQDLGEYKPGTIVEPFLGNLPLWSLSYEVFFYLVFPLIMVVRRRSRHLALGVVGGLSVIGYLSYVAAPNHFSIVLAYLLVWWAGAFIADLYSSYELGLSSLIPLVGWIVALCLVAAVAYGYNDSANLSLFLRQSLRLFVFTLLCLAVVGSKLVNVLVRATSWLPGPAAYIASISYGLYLFHYPLLIQWDFVHSPLTFVVAVLLLVGISVIGDRYLDRVLPKPKRPRNAALAEGGGARPAHDRV